MRPNSAVEASFATRSIDGRSRKRRILLRRVLLTLLLPSVVVAIYLLRGPLLARPLAALVEHRLSAALGQKVVVDRIEGGLFRDAALIGVRMETLPPGLRRLDAERLATTYDLVALLRGDAAGLRSVAASGVVVEADVRTPAGDVAGRGSVASPDAFAFLPASLPRIVVEGALLVLLDDGDVRAERFELRAEGSVARFGVYGLQRRTGASFDAPRDLELNVVRSEPRRITITSPTSWDGVSIEEIALDFPSEGPVASEFRLLVAGAPLEGSLRGDELSVRASGVDLSRLPDWTAAFYGKNFTPPAGGVVTADVVVVVRGEAAGLRGALSVRDLLWKGERFEFVAAVGGWNGERGAVDRLEIVSEKARIAARGVGLDARTPWLVRRLESVTVDAPDTAAWVATLPAFAGSSEFVRQVKAITILASSPDGTTVEIRRAEATLADGAIVAGGSLTLPADPFGWTETKLDLRASGRGFELARLLPGAAARHSGEAAPESAPVAGGWHGRCDWDARITGAATRPSIAIHATASEVGCEDGTWRDIALAAEIDWPIAHVTELSVRAGPISGALGCVVDLSAQVATEGWFRCDVPDAGAIARFVPELRPLQGVAHAEGSFAHVSRTSIAAGGTLAGRAVKSASRRGLSAWSGDVVVRGRDLRAGAFACDALEFDAHGGGSSYTVTRAVVRAGDRTASLAQPAELAIRDGAWTSSAFVVDAAGGRLRGSFSFAKEIDLRLEGTAIDAAAFPGGVTGAASFVLLATGAPDRPDATLTASSDALGFGGLRGRVALTAVQTAAGVSITSIEIDGGAAYGLSGAGFAPWIVGCDGLRRVPGRRADFHGEARSAELSPFAPFGLPPELRLSESVIKAADRDGTFAATLTGRDLGWIDERGTLRLEGESRAELRFDDATAQLTASLGEGGATHGRVRLETTGPTDLRRLDGLAARLGVQEVRGEATVAIPDLSRFLPLLPGCESLRGAFAARIDVAGSRADPRLRGTATLDDASLSFKSDVPAIEGSARLTLTDRTLVLDRLEGRLGYAPIVVSGSGVLDRDGGVAIALAVTGRNVLLTRTDDLRVRADVDVTVAGPLEAAEVRGDVRVVQAVYSEPLRLGTEAEPSGVREFIPFSLRSKPLSGLRFDVHGVAEETIRIDNGLIRGTASADLRLRGTGERPHLEGSIRLRDGTARLPFARLEIDHGEVVFRREDDFLPRIEASAHTRVRAYDLAVRARGVVPNVELAVDSQPPLPRQDAVYLLSSGSAPGELQGGAAGWSTLQSTGTMAGSKLLTGLSDAADDDSVVDRFTFATGRDGSQGGAAALEAEFRLNDRFYLRAERDGFEDYNLGVVWRLRFR